MKQRLKRAFTITELVIVIAVIAVLAAVLIPTFASVIDESKKSHDTQYMKEINVAIADYAALHGSAPADYDELMLALADAGLCDTNNPFLLATELKQDNMLLVWYPGTDKVRLVDTSTESLLFSHDRGYGNYVLLYTEGASVIEHDGYFILCNTGHPDSMIAAEVYRQLYVLAGGDLNSFLNGDSLDDLIKDMENKSWAHSIVNAVQNAKNGYTYSQNTAQGILDDFKAASSAQVDLTENLSQADQQVLQSGKSFEDLSDEGKAAVEQGVRGTLATLATLENDSKTKNDIAGKKVELNVPAGTEVDMTGVTLTAIGNTYRKEGEVKAGDKSTLSVDYGNITLENLEIPSNTFNSSGADYQPEDDSGRAGGGYAFTYGMFGTVVAAPGQTVTIENLHLKGVHFDFTGATETVNGQTMNTFADNAGIIVGYAQGNVILRNITVDGIDKEGQVGLIKGYDGIAGVIGRWYHGAGKAATSCTIENVKISNMVIQGERRASGFIGYVSGDNLNVTIKGCTLDRVTIVAHRDISDPSTKQQCWANVFYHSSHYSGTMTVTDNTLIDVLTGVSFKGDTVDKLSGNLGFNVEAKKGYIHSMNPVTRLPETSASDAYRYLLLFGVNDGSAGLINMTGTKVIVQNSEQKTTYLVQDIAPGTGQWGAELTLTQQN